jgi:branched-chain amino acid transport system substrate-binding protein
MKKWNSIAIILVIIGMVFGIALSPKQAQAADPIIVKVGMPTCLSGPAAPWGQIGMEPYHTWIGLFNKEGFKVGGKTYNFKLITVDDKNTPEGGAAAAKQLIYSDGCKFLAGHWTWNFPAVATVANQAKAILFTRNGNEAVPGGVYDPKKFPYVVFANNSMDQYDYDHLAIVEAYPQYKKIGVLDCVVGKGPGADIAEAFFKEHGIRFAREWFPFGTQDFTPYITRFKEAGCDIIYVAGWVGETMAVAKQRWEMGYKDMKVGHSGPFVDVGMYIAVVGADAAQGMIGQYWANWDFKKTKVNPKYIKMCQEVNAIVSKKQGKPFNYSGWVGWLPNHLLILAQAIQKAGTVDNTDAIMKAIRGGTFDTTIGKWTMSGAKTWGSPIVFGCPSALCVIKGDKEVYLSEHPTKPIP